MPKEARWPHLQANAKQPTIGKLVDDAMVALPGQLFYSTQIPVCLWFIARNKSGQPSPAAARHPLPVGEAQGEGKKLRDRRGETLFIDARKMGTLIDRVHRELTDSDLEKITSIYHAWRGDGLTRSRGERGEKSSGSESLRASA